ncbi:MAG: hypothetical protein ABI678_08575 [Kofleriaceae bacterium]
MRRVLLVGFAVITCALVAPSPASAASEEDIDACTVVCDGLRLSACWGLELDPLCEYEWLCEAICEDNPYEMMCIRETPDAEVCCETYYGCWEVVEPNCSYAC